MLMTAPLWAQGIAPQPDESLIEHAAVTLRALDKITARISEFSVDIGAVHSFGSLRIKPTYCRTRPPIEQPETFAYLEIDQQRPTGEMERVFDGWMIASNPAVNPLEHSVYDVWVINCTKVAPFTDGGR